MKEQIQIGSRMIGENSPAFIIAEMSANHRMDYDRAARIVEAAREAGADAIKLQTYTADTITLDCDNSYFRISQGTLWDGATFHSLYKEAYTPWEWQPRLFSLAGELGLECFSSPFDGSAVDFLEGIGAPAYKIASFEITDIPLIRRVAGTGKPVIISAGIAGEEDIRLALKTCREEGNEQVILLKCTSAYPAPYEDVHLRSIPYIKEAYHTLTGLSDHTLGTEVAVAAVALGARVIEKHLTLSRKDGGPDAAFSMEPEEFKEMAGQIRNVEKAMGENTYRLSRKQIESRKFSRSLFAVKDIKKGDVFTEENVRSVRPGDGLHTRYYEEILGRPASRDILRGTPLDWGMVKA